MKKEIGWIKNAVKDGVLIEMDTTGGEGATCSKPVVLTPSLNDATAGDKLRAARLLDSFQRTLKAWRFMGDKPPRVLKCYIDAKQGLYFECQAMPWDETGRPCLVFAMPGQFLPGGEGVREIPEEQRRELRGLSAEERAELRALAVRTARRVLADDNAPEEAKRAARELRGLMGKGAEGDGAE